MEINHRNEQTESTGDRSSAIRQSVPREWQFSLRGLLITTTVASICLALGTVLAGVAFAVFILVIIQVATLLAADWLIRPANRRMLAFVSSGSWIIIGSGLLIIGAKVVYRSIASGAPRNVLVTAPIAIVAAAFCYGLGWRRWRRLTARENL